MLQPPAAAETAWARMSFSLLATHGLIPRANGDGAIARYWAPACTQLEVVIAGRAIPLSRGARGWWTGHVPDATAQTRYQLRIDGSRLIPDPYSRDQPGGARHAGNDEFQRGTCRRTACTVIPRLVIVCPP